jgi:hypothetical protein
VTTDLEIIEHVRAEFAGSNLLQTDPFIRFVASTSAAAAAIMGVVSFASVFA